MNKAGNPNWLPGKSGNPHGRPRGSRTVAIEIIYKMFSKYGKKAFAQEMRKLVKQNPVAYYLKFIQPIQPKDITFLAGDKDIKSIEIKINKTYDREIKKLGIIDIKTDVED